MCKICYSSSPFTSQEKTVTSEVREAIADHFNWWGNGSSPPFQSPIFAAYNSTGCRRGDIARNLESLGGDLQSGMPHFYCRVKLTFLPLVMCLKRESSKTDSVNQMPYLPYICIPTIKTALFDSDSEWRQQMWDKDQPWRQLIFADWWMDRQLLIQQRGRALRLCLNGASLISHSKKGYKWMPPICPLRVIDSWIWTCKVSQCT